MNSFSCALRAICSVLAFLLLTINTVRADIFEAPASLNSQSSQLLAAKSANTHEFLVTQGHDGWRLVVDSSHTISVTVRNVTKDLLIHSSTTKTKTLFFSPDELVEGDEYSVTLNNQNTFAVNYTVASEGKYARAISWDNGTAQPAWLERPTTETGFTKGDWLFKVKRPSYSLFGLARAVLEVDAGSAGMAVTLYSGSLTGHYHNSSNSGDNILYLDDQQLPVGVDVYILVSQRVAEDVPQSWRLMLGDIYVHDLGELTEGFSTGTLKIVGVEETLFFRTQVNDQAKAWRLFLSADDDSSVNHKIAVRKNAPAMPGRFSDKEFMRQQLLVPDYLSSGNYFVGVKAAKGTRINLKSSLQPVIDLPFSSSSQSYAVTEDEFNYKTFKVSVPVDQIAWQVQLKPTLGSSDLYVRRDKVPNSGDNDGLSEATGSVIDSVTHVPPFLTAGIWYVSVRANGDASFSLKSGNPVVTDIPFVNNPQAVPNGADFENLSGWRYYRVQNIQSQLGFLGWEIRLNNALSGTQIAVRRNAVPTVWKYRQNDNVYSSESSIHDQISSSGLLQRPDHQADVWYVGISRVEALGPFTFNTYTSTPPVLDFNNGSVNVSEQNPAHWRYFKVTVPEGVEGWDLKLTHLSGGKANFVVSKDDLPNNLQTSTDSGCGLYIPLYRCNIWRPGEQISAFNGWAGKYADSNGSEYKSRHLVVGTGRPLVAGTYYIGVTGEAPNDSQLLNYKLQSRGIGQQCAGTACTIQVQELAYTGSSQGNIATVRDAAYYKVTVPEGIVGWEFKTNLITGDAALAAGLGALPNSYASQYYSNSTDATLSSGSMRDKAGSEYLYMFANDYYQGNEVFRQVKPGTYYFAVISQGQNAPDNSSTGSSSVAFSVHSAAFTVSDRTTTPLSSEQPISWLDQQLKFGEVAAYRIRVPEQGISNMEVRLKSKAGKPRMTLRREDQSIAYLPYPDYASYRSVEGGMYYNSADDDLITIAGPKGDYTVLVFSTEQDVSYDLEFVSQGEASLSFNSGVISVNEQAAQTWRYFRVDVPEDADGWEVLLDGISGDQPNFVVRKNELPDKLETSKDVCLYYNPLNNCSSWEDGLQLAAPSQDWAGRYYSAGSSQQVERSRRLLMGKNQPLQAGTYYVGVTSENPASTAPMNYTIYSRGVGSSCAGQNCAITVTALPYDGLLTGTIDKPREAAYYKVTVPEGEQAWQIRLEPEEGHEMALVVHAGAMVNSFPGGTSSDDLRSVGLKLDKPGREYFHKLHENKYNSSQGVMETVLTPGDYYIAVISQGQQPSQNSVGTGAVNFTLSSSPLVPNDLSSSPLLDGGTLSWNDQSLHLGEVKLYRFNVAPGISNMEIRMNVRSGTPRLTYRNDTDAAKIPSPFTETGYRSFEGGIGGSASSVYLHPVTSPEGTYTVAVYGQASDADYDLQVVARGEQQLVFNNGSLQVLEQEAGSWRYFRVDVPDNAEGWEILLNNVSGDQPNFVIRRDLLPVSLNQQSDSDCIYVPTYLCNSWRTGASVQPSAYGWSYEYYESDGKTPVSERRLVVGMNNPLEPGVYYIGVTNEANTASGIMSYQIHSRGIGDSCGAHACQIKVTPLGFQQSLHGSISNPRDAVYYKVAVPDGQPGWELKLEPDVGEVGMGIRYAALPSSHLSYQTSDSTMFYSGVRRQKVGAEYFYKLPEQYYNPETGSNERKLRDGNYYVAVFSQGQGSTVNSNSIGSGSVSFTISSARFDAADKTVTPVQQGTPVRWVSQSLNFGEFKAYRIRVAEGVSNLEVRLTNVSGAPMMRAIRHDEGSSVMPSQPDFVYLDYRSAEGGEHSYHQHAEVINIANPVGDVTVLVRGDKVNNQQAPLSYDISFSAPQVRVLAFENGQFTNQNLGNAQQHLYRVEVPEDQQLAGWQIDTRLLSGKIKLRVAKDVPPGAVTQFAPAQSEQGQFVITSPVLTAGTWYVEVSSDGVSEYNISSSRVKAAASWQLAQNESDGVVSGDSGPVDLAAGRTEFYQIEVPDGNNGLIRAELIKISGEAEMMLRHQYAPTSNHNAAGAAGVLYDRTNVAPNSQYSNWSVINGRDGFEDGKIQLKPGIWWLAVKAKESNIRYQLKVSNGNIQNMALNGGNKTGQTLAAGDMRYYKVWVPDSSVQQSSSTPDWKVRLTQQSGDVALLVRETLPTGQPSTIYTVGSTYGFGSFYTWYNDNYESNLPIYIEEGELHVTLEMVKPGKYVYLGVYAYTDAVFDLSTTYGTERLKLDASVNYTNGVAELLIPAGGQRLVKVPVPADAEFYRHQLQASSNVVLYQYVDKPASPQRTINQNSGTHTFEYRLTQRDRSLGFYPWIPGLTHYILLKNQGTEDETVRFTTSGNVWEPDIQAPVFDDLPIVLVEASGMLTAFTPSTLYAKDDYDGNIVATTDFKGPLAMGGYIIDWTAVDSSGNIGTAQQQVIVADTIAPSVSAPPSIYKEADGVETEVELGQASVTDTVWSDLTAAADNIGPFAVGSHVVTWSATDGAGNTATALQSVVVSDTSGPEFSGELALKLSTKNENGISRSDSAIAEFLEQIKATDKVDGEVTVNSNAPSIFPIGSTVVTLQSNDSRGNSSSASLLVEVVLDKNLPVLTVPAAIEVVTGSTEGIKRTDRKIAIFLRAAKATDVEDGDLEVTHNAPELLSIGVTNVLFSATDTAGNEVAKVVSITVTYDPNIKKKRRRSMLPIIVGAQKQN